MLGPLNARLQALRVQLDLLQNQLIDRMRPVRYNQLVTSRAYLIRLYEDLDAIEHGYEASLPGFYSDLPIGHRILFALAQRSDIREREQTEQATWQEMAQRFTLDALIPRWREIVRQEHGVRNDGFATEGHMPPFQTVDQEAAHVGRLEDTYEGLELEEIQHLEFGGIMPNGQRLWFENLQRNTTMQLRNNYEVWRMNQPEPYFDPVFGHPFDMPPPQYEPQPPNGAQPPMQAPPADYAQPLYEAQPPMQAHNLNPFAGMQDPFYDQIWPGNGIPYGNGVPFEDDDSQDDRSSYNGNGSSGYDDTETETEIDRTSSSNSSQFHGTPTPPVARLNSTPTPRLDYQPVPLVYNSPARGLNNHPAPCLNNLPPARVNTTTLLNNGQPVQNVSNVRTQFSPPSPLTPLSSEGSGALGNVGSNVSIDGGSRVTSNEGSRIFIKEESPFIFEEDARGLASLIPSRCGSEDTARFTDPDACSDTSTELDTDIDVDAEYDSEGDSEYYPSSEGTVRFESFSKLFVLSFKPDVLAILAFVSETILIDLKFPDRAKNMLPLLCNRKRLMIQYLDMLHYSTLYR